MPLEMWGGLECTLNRVGDRYINQCDKSGHNKRLSDLQLFHDLGIKKLRYPCLWELVAPKDLDHCDWSFLDERLGELKRLGQDFIAGFLHHGSGPFYTSLIDPDFPEKFSTFARLFIQRYPWVNDFTPINEINTTARFSVLYGHWYPHLQDESLYLRSMMLQCKATVLAMREIRRVNPKAKLIQTDDLGKCQSTEEVAEQRDFENHRRWLAWDLLCGKVTKNHPLYNRFLKNKIREEDLQWFEENACPPDVIGINHYHLSNRYLDHRMEHFPTWSHGGNGEVAYADVGAVDTGFVDPVNPEVIMREAWERYKIPLAITECHTMGHRESQLRWLNQMWQTCQKLRAEGVDVKALTVWSLLGTYDWHNLCTNCEFFYEPGVFDLRNSQKIPKPTALTKMVKSLATQGEYDLPILKSEGVWNTGRRILFSVKHGQFSSLDHSEEVRPVLIIGGTGSLGQAFARICGGRNIHYKLIDSIDISNRKSIDDAIERYHPWAIINAAGSEEDNCLSGKVDAATNLARACRFSEIQLVNFSSNADCEEEILSIYPESLMIRTSAHFSPWDDFNFITETLRSLADNSEVIAPNDIYISPTYVPDLVNECLNLLIDEETGIFQITNMGEVSWEQFALLAAEVAKEKIAINTDLIKGMSAHEMTWRAKRPINPTLVSERIQQLPTLEDAIGRYVKDLQIPIEFKQEIL